MRRYNLIDEKWIPVRYPDGTHAELGIRETLLMAKELGAIEDPSPLVTAALYRFLLALIYRALEGPTDIVEARTFFREGFPRDRIEAYLEKWRDRFWLFDEKYPFGQNPHVPPDEIEPWTKLTAEHNATSNKVLFDHTATKYPEERSPKECARWLLSTMSFSIAGGRGYYPSPSPNAMLCIPLGPALHQTLSYCLVPQNEEVSRGDTALWEREPVDLPLGTPKRAALGYADLLTWQSRMVLLEEEESGNVRKMRFIAGVGFENPTANPDPMQPFKTDEKFGRLPVSFRGDRGTWRDFDSLLPDQGGLSPLTVQNAFQLAGKSSELLPSSMLVLGLRYEPPNANLDFWRMERYALPKTLRDDHAVRHEIRALLDGVEKAQSALWAASRSFARDLLSRGDRLPDKKDIKAFVDQMLSTPLYWSTMESRFQEVLREYGLDRDPEDIRIQWLRWVAEALGAAWEQHRASVFMGDAWTIRAVVKAEKFVGRKIAQIREEIEQQEPKKEEV
ncbi:MAG TPA: type I-E CRISPR-associated protein Cse1/CasA [Rectinemataceae bacterium]|nr:type I-E CRISPR-associated protein Cse1/CasA [Rectinemataceae bacterium]